MPDMKNYDLTTLYFPGRVMDKLGLIKSYPMTIVEAPSGFGKTTAVRAFFSKYVGERAPVYWHTFLGEAFSVSWKSLCDIFGRTDRESADKLLGASEYFMGISGIFPNLLPQVYTNIYLAQANAALGKEAEAVRLLADALETALPDKLYMPFAENGEGLKKLLPLAAERVTDKEGIANINELARDLRKSVRKIQTDRPALSDREQEVYALIVEGLTNKQIADRLYISLSTVKTLVSRILEKMGAASRTQLAGQKR